MRVIVFFLILLSAPLWMTAQVNDDFSDSELLNDPLWQGDIDDFIVNSELQLELDAEAVSDTSVLVTQISLDPTEQMSWEFWMEVDFDPSNSNNIRYYLMSDQANLKSDLNGYFLRIGENGAEDKIRLFKQSGSANSAVEIFNDGVTIYASAPLARIRVIRESNGTWTISSDNTGGSDFIEEGSVNDSEITTMEYSGFFLKYTASNSNAFRFDDVVISGQVEVDLTPPTATGINVINSTTIEVSFSEALDETSAENVSNYSVNGLGNPILASLLGDLSTVSLEFGTDFPENIEQTLSINGVNDLEGNTADDIELNFSYVVAETAAFRDVVINEIYADPTPSFGLPEFEYVELFNAGTGFFDLSNWVFVNSETEKILPSFVLEPGEFVILCDEDAEAEFSEYGPVIGISSFTALTNSSDSLSLRNSDDEVIDIVVYSSDWYNDPEKEDGGWSIEQVNPFLSCSGAHNWIASNEVSGGTPSEVNSVFSDEPDLSGPVLISAAILSDDSFSLSFNEPLSAAAIENAEILVEGGLGILDVSLNTSGTVLTVLIDDIFSTGISYTVTVNNVSDCEGNTAASQEIELISGFDPEPGDVIITEIMADPSPVVGLPEAEFLELYNRTDQLLDLSACELSGAVFPAQTFIAPNQYLTILSEQAQQEFAFYTTAVPMQNWSSTFLTNSGKELILTNAEGVTVDSLFYNIDWYNDASKDDGGWSLELINPNDPCSDQSNWSASNSSTGGTPGEENSIWDLSEDEESPLLLSVYVPGPQFLQLNFSEPIDGNSISEDNIELSGGLGIEEISYLNDPITEVLLTLDPQMEEGIIYELSLSGVLDCWGNGEDEVLNGNFAVPELASPGDLIVNEILSNPYDGGADFIEIYNNSNKNISLFGWQLASEEDGEPANERLVSDVDRLIYPGEYMVLTTASELVTNFYPNAREDRIFEMESLPSYSNGEGVVYLLDPIFQISDRVPYSEDQHFPLIDDLNGVSLERLDFNRASDDAGNWHSAAQTEGFATPGYENSQLAVGLPGSSELSTESEIFSPDNDGYQDVLLINYSLDAPGYTGSLWIYDDQGRQVRELARNELLGKSGTYSWDGFTDDRQKAGIGIYVIVAEIFNSDGNVEVLKAPCVLAHQLN